jgi:hypothetical protein
MSPTEPVNGRCARSASAKLAMIDLISCRSRCGSDWRTTPAATDSNCDPRAPRNPRRVPTPVPPNDPGAHRNRRADALPPRPRDEWSLRQKERDVFQCQLAAAVGSFSLRCVQHGTVRSGKPGADARSRRIHRPHCGPRVESFKFAALIFAICVRRLPGHEANDGVDLADADDTASTGPPLPSERGRWPAPASRPRAPRRMPSVNVTAKIPTQHPTTPM